MSVHATIDSGSWDTGNALAWNMLKGFSLYEHASDPDIRVPYADAGGALTITPPSGYTKTSDHIGCIASNTIHNGAETKLKQQNGQESELGHSELFYEADGVTEKEVTFADILAWVSGTDNTWLKFIKPGDVCLLADSVIFDSSKVITEAEYSQLISWRGSAPCGGGVVPPP